MEHSEQKAAFVSIIGKPNAGKSTLLNAVLDFKLAITNSKIQTTRHRIKGIVNRNNTQLVFSDTPGIINPAYKLQEEMMNAVHESIADSDIIVILIDVNDSHIPDEITSIINASSAKKLLVINKIDESDQEMVTRIMGKFQKMFLVDDTLVISALRKFNIAGLLDKLVELSPRHEAYYPKDQLTDKSERFFVSEFIREKILTHYQQEIPYSVEVEVDSFKVEPNITKISAIIYVERDSQKVIIIGKSGLGLKRVGSEARRDIEKFLNQKVFLKLFIKVKKKWRNDDRLLKSFGYKKK